MNSKDVYAVLQPLGLKPLHKIWAKIEILLGLVAVFLGLWVIALSPKIGGLPSPPDVSEFHYFSAGLILFVLGGYLAMAGHRSHLYQSNNQLIAFVIEEIRKSANKESKP